MPWDTKDIMSLREEFVGLASQEGVNRRALCRRFGISAQTAYKWLARYAEEGQAGLINRPRRPHHSPSETPPTIQASVVAMRTQHPAWGGRKISRRLQDMGLPSVAPSTVSSILSRHGLILPPAPDFVDVSDARILIVDDVADTGHTLRSVQEFCAGKVAEVRTGVLYEKSHSLVKCDYIWKRTDLWINFPWSDKDPVAKREWSVADA